MSSIYRYNCKLKKIVDGDTVDVIADLGFRLTATMRLRLAGINTPEVRGKEREAGLVSKQYVEDALQSACTIAIITNKTGKYGRYIADIYYSIDPDIEWYDVLNNGKHLNQELLDNNLATKV